MTHARLLLGMLGVASKKLRRFIPYWLRGSEHHCAGCHAAHAYAVTVHCAGCDRNYCSFCVETVGEDRLCSDCRGEKQRRPKRLWRRARSGKA